ncbi:hypothetical protein ABW19_dt0204634 [Dactylella cylindrospora]|nr:hypothetical protein ABW19_dt0204634 [Dactylella cylindrospora]
MAKPKKKPSKAPTTAEEDKSVTTNNDDDPSPPIKAEDLTDEMLIDSRPTSSTLEDLPALNSIKVEIKPESRTVSPDLQPLNPRFDFDGALMLEDPEFDEDFVPVAGEDIDMTSLAVPAPAPPVAEGEATANPLHKRGVEDADEAFDDGPLSKRRKLEDGEEAPVTVASPPKQTDSAVSVDRLSPALLTEIFTYIGLPTIGRLRSVCKRFSELLEKEYIWRRCRKIHCPDMPKPVFGMKEWDMWSLARGRGCLKCDKYDGEGRDEGNLKVYWQFRVRCCAGCFRANVAKEAELLAQADQKVPVEVMKHLISALPYGLVDSNYNWIPTTTPNPTEAERVYWNEDIAEIKERYDEAQQMDAAEEWLKGLEGEGHGHKADADRMEKWEVRVQNGNSYNPSTNSTQKKGGSEKIGNQQSTASAKNNNGIPVMVSNDNPPFQPQSIPTFYQRGRQFGDRSHQEVEDMKARRKADIEARCLKLNPPIPPEILAHCPAFQASLRISQPLNDASWNLLLPKLLEQRAGAEEYETQRQIHSKQLEQQLEDRKSLESQERDQWVKKERQWEEAQAPVREMISKIADEEIKGWDGKVKFETSPAFAASILASVRTRYYERGGVQEASSASDNTPASSNSTSSSSKPPKPQDSRPKVRQLVLENMKYVFDNKIKPVTDPFRRELFYCRACKDLAANPTAGTIITHPRLYGFEGVIQHFAAKHTTNMSLGTVVVHWRSAWPEDAPFVVDEREIKRLMTRPPGGGNHPGGTLQGPVLIRTTGPPVPVALTVPGYGYSHPHPSQHHPAQHRMHPGPGPQHVIPEPSHYGRVPRGQPYPMESPHHPSYHQPPPVPHHVHHPSQVHPLLHPGHQPYAVQAPVPVPISSRSQPYPAHPQPGYPPQPVYHQHPQPPVQANHPPYNGYPPHYPGPAQQAQPPYAGYGTTVSSQPGPIPASLYLGPQPVHPPIPQPDPFEEAAKKEAEAAAAAAAEKDRKDKIYYIASYAEQIWKNLGTAKALEPSIRALLMVHETVSAFFDKYRTELTIQLFHEATRTEIEGALKFLKLGNNKLECRSCSKNSTRTFTLPLLLQHFESIHLFRPNLGPSAKEQGVKQKRFDWLLDMIRLPPEEEVQKMIGKPGFDKKKLAPVEKVYPGVFDRKPTEPVSAAVSTRASTEDAGAETTTAKHTSKASISAAERFLDSLLPGSVSTSEPPSARSSDVKNSKSTSAARSPEPGETEESEVPTKGDSSRPVSRSPSRSLDRRRSESRRRRSSLDDGYRRPLARDPIYSEDGYRRFPSDEYYSRPPRGRSPDPYDRYPSPVGYRVYRRYDDYEMVARERYVSPPPAARQPETQSAAVPPPAGGLDYDEQPVAPIPVSGHVRDSSRDVRLAEDLEYRRGYQAAPPPAAYYERVFERDPRYPPPPGGYYERPPPRYYDERLMHHPYYYDDMYEYERSRHAPPPGHPPPVRLYREDYDRYYERDRAEGYRRPAPVVRTRSLEREREVDDAFDRATGRDVRRRSRSPEVGEREWSGRERRGYAVSPPGAAVRDWREEPARGRPALRGRGAGRGG